MLPADLKNMDSKKTVIATILEKKYQTNFLYTLRYVQ